MCWVMGPYEMGLEGLIPSNVFPAEVVHAVNVDFPVVCNCFVVLNDSYSI
jgi:hypothetical protein